ncbi:hypothetical protein K6V78_01755 [Streptococcus gallolyticus]|nr:hypothetical protein [Streptococcus gallolyticus]MBY5040364.1 hypothetical protein [Streptococcus gallolyticus]
MLYRKVLPFQYGVNVLQGAYTLYNFNPEANSKITAAISELNVGQDSQLIVGSGVFVSGFNDAGGQVVIDKMVLGSVHSTGLLPQGVADFITGGVFVVYGAHVHELHQLDKTVTYGVNDMVLDAWGTVDKWVVEDEVISYGQSLVEGVNVDLPAYAFSIKDGGSLHQLHVKDSIVSYGDNVTTVTMEEGGSLGQAAVDGKVAALGNNSKAFSDANIEKQF